MEIDTHDTMPVTTRLKILTACIKHNIDLCGIPDDTSMVEIIQQ
jgi:hypothetical protein